MKKVEYNYFKADKKYLKKNKNNVVRYGKFIFVCDNDEQAELMKQWLKGGDNFEIK